MIRKRREFSAYFLSEFSMEILDSHRSTLLSALPRTLVFAVLTLRNT